MGLFGNFSPMADHPCPLLRTDCSKKNKLILHIGPRLHFCFFTKRVIFCLTFAFYANRRPSPLPQGKNSQIIPFLLIFPKRTRPKIQLPLSNQINQISPPSFCKICFNTSELFWHTRNYLVNLQKF